MNHALIAAIQEGEAEKVADVLRESDPDVDFIDEGMTPLSWACQINRADLARLLLDAGANPTLAAEEGETPLHIAAFEAFEECVNLLLERGASTSSTTDLGKTALMNAAQAGSRAVLSALLAAGADAKAADAAGRTALHWAVVGMHDDPSIARMLVDAGTDPARRNQDGETALDYARGLNKAAIELELSQE